jgi:hypothetical protein
MNDDAAPKRSGKGLHMSDDIVAAHLAGICTKGYRLSKTGYLTGKPALYFGQD